MVQLKHAEQWIYTIGMYAMPELGGLDVNEITYDDVLQILRPMWKSKTVTASRVRGRLEAIFDYAVRKKYRTKENPARWKGLLEFDLPRQSKVTIVKHHAAPALEDLQRAAVTLYKSDAGSHLATLFGILTATRCGEFCPAKWDEINFKTRTWYIPPERRKDGKTYPHRVPLSTWAIKVLKKIPRSHREAIFQGQYREHLSKEMPRVILINAIRKPVTMHGCRSTFSDWCYEHGKNPILTEKSLMHATGNEVYQAYQRSDLLEERRPLMEEYANVIMANAAALGL